MKFCDINCLMNDVVQLISQFSILNYQFNK